MSDVISDDQIAELRRLLIDRVEENDPGRDAHVALSGGIDSTTVLFAALASGRRPVCYTFYVEGQISEDFQAARRLTEHFKLDHVLVEIPWDLETLVADCRWLISKAHVVKRTVIQCMHPWKYIYPAMRSKVILSGLGADDYYCTDKRSAMHLHKGGEERLLEYGYRVDDSHNLEYSDGNSIALAKTFDKVNVNLYGRKDIQDWFMQFKIKQLHTPKQKYPSLKAFEEYWSQGNFFRKQSPYQINSRLRDLHDMLLWSKYNTRDLKDVVGIYRDMADGRV